MHSRIITRIPQVIIIFIMVLLGIVGGGRLILAAELTVPADVRSDSVIFTPLSSPPGTCNASIEGRIYYNSGDNTFYYCNGSGWQPFGAGDYRVANIIVSAYNSYGALESDGSACEVGDATCNNPKADEGYTCTGSASGAASDARIIQNAIDALPASGGVIYLLEGTYNIGTSITLNKPGVAIIGAGMGSTLLNIVSNLSPSVFYIYNTQKIMLSRMTIQAASGVSCEAGILLNGSSYSAIDTVYVENMFAASGTGIKLSNSTNNIISDSVLRLNRHSGIWLDALSNNNIIFRNNALNTFAGFLDRGGIYLNASHNNTISQNNIQNTFGNGLRLVQSNSNLIANNNIQGNDGSGGVEPYAGISLETSSYNTICKNNVQDNAKYGIYLAASSAPYTCGNIISGNHIQGSLRHGLYVNTRSDRNIVIANEFVGNDSAATRTYDGMRLSGSSFNIISSNFALDNGYWGMYMQHSTGSQQNYLLGNFCSGAYNIYDYLDTSSQYTDSLKITLEQKQFSISSSSYTLDTATYPRGYAALNPSTNTTLTLANGKAAGDTLILHNISSTRTVTISNSANVKLRTTPSPTSPRTLSKNDTLTLFWNGSYWLEAGYSRYNY